MLELYINLLYFQVHIIFKYSVHDYRLPAGPLLTTVHIYSTTQMPSNNSTFEVVSVTHIYTVCACVCVHMRERGGGVDLHSVFSVELSLGTSS